MKTKAILLMVFFLGWVTTGWAADHVKGDGKLTSKKISVADYNEIKVDGVIDFNYEQSDDPSTVEVTVDQNLHPYVNIEVKDRVLIIAFKGAKVGHFTKFIRKDEFLNGLPPQSFRKCQLHGKQSAYRRRDRY